MIENTVTVNIPDEAWEQNDSLENPSDRLLATLIVNTTFMHLEAWAVAYNEDEAMQHLADGDDDDLDRLSEAVHADGSFQITRIRGRDYILVASPFC
jgi:hypothetical protein